MRLRDSDPPAASLALVASLVLYDTAMVFIRGNDDTELILKWPNDLLFDNAKLSGILLEREADAVVIGTGVNLAHHPEIQERPATSIAAHAETPDPEEFLRTLAETFAWWLARWRGEGLPHIRDAWLQRAHPLGTRLRTHDAKGKPIEGTFDGLTSEGSLQLRLADGSSRVIHAGDVFLI